MVANLQDWWLITGLGFLPLNLMRLSVWIPTILRKKYRLVRRRLDRRGMLNGKKAQRAAPHADTSALESELDCLVYGLYGLTEEEVQVVENQ